MNIRGLLFGVITGLLSISSFASNVENQIVQNIPNQVKQNINIVKNKNIEESVPKYATEWLNYIKNNNPELECPQDKLSSICTFLSTVQIDDAQGELNLLLKGSSFVKGYINLPTINKVQNEDGNSKVWFKQVLVNEKEAVWLKRDYNFIVEVDKGDFEIRVILSKDSSKELSSISFNGNPIILKNNVKNKNFIKDGNTIRLVADRIVDNDLIKSPISLDGNKRDLEINVFRKIEAGIPNLLNTQLKITYTGKPKDLFLGKILPKDFEFSIAQSSLGIEKKEDGFWVKLVAGEHEVNIESFLLKNIALIDVKNLISSVDSEIWYLEQKNNIRQVELIAEQQIDAKNANGPKEWLTQPAFLVKDMVKLKTNGRGIEENKKIKIDTQRISYFGLENDKMITLDKMKIKNQGVQFFSQNNNLTKAESFQIKKENQVLVSVSNKLGVIIPKGDFEAISQSVSESKELNTQFWDAETSITNWRINLAPRMRLLAVTGEYLESNGTWLDSWTLYSIFATFLIVLTFYKLFGKTTASMALLGLLIFQGQSFSWLLWLSILFVLGLLKVLPDSYESRFARIVSILGLVIFSLFAIYSLDFIRTEIQLVINPSLEIISNSLKILDSNNYLIHLGLVSIFVILFVLLFNNKKKLSIGGWITLVIFIFIFFSAQGLLTTAKQTVFGSNGVVFGNGASNSHYIESKDKAMAMAPALMSSRNVNSEDFSRSEIKEISKKEIILQKAQVGSGEPMWLYLSGSYGNNNSYDISSIGPLTKESKVSFWIAPIWMVNIFSLIQIVFLIMTMYLFGLGLLNLSNKKDWTIKIPYKLREHWITKLLISNDFKKGL